DRRHDRSAKRLDPVQQGLDVGAFRIEDDTRVIAGKRLADPAIHAAARVRIDEDVTPLHRLRMPAEQLRVEPGRLRRPWSQNLEPRDGVAHGVPPLGRARRHVTAGVWMGSTLPTLGRYR